MQCDLQRFLIAAKNLGYEAEQTAELWVMVSPQNYPVTLRDLDQVIVSLNDPYLTMLDEIRAHLSLVTVNDLSCSRIAGEFLKYLSRAYGICFGKLFSCRLILITFRIGK